MTESELIVTLDFDELLSDLSRGIPLSKESKEQLSLFVQQQVANPKEKRSLEDLFAAFTVISKSDDAKLSYLLDLAFEVPDPMLVCLALETLVVKWGIYEPVVERLIQYALGASFDYDGDVREMALECIRWIFSQKKVGGGVVEKLSQLLVHILGDEGEETGLKAVVMEVLEIRDGKRKVG